MKKCERCGKKGLFLKLSPEKLCQNCVSLLKFENDKQELEVNISLAQQKLSKIEATLKNRDEEYKKLVREAKIEATKLCEVELSQLNTKIHAVEEEIQLKCAKNDELSQEHDKLKKSTILSSNKLKRLKEAIKAASYAENRIDESGNYISDINSMNVDINEYEKLIEPTVTLKLKCMDMKQLRSEFNDNKKLISKSAELYKSRYTTKTNAAIYSLMVIALEAELQNILYSLNYNKLDKSIENVKIITRKYESIATAGNQTIANTLRKFIGEIEYLFIRAVEIEYEYYVQKERMKEEQQAIREQMRQEAQERKELEAQQKHLEKEEAKYNQEIEIVQDAIMQEKDNDKILQLQARIEKLQDQLSSLHHKREEILKLQTGKAGNIYIISNLGSFGDNVFKVGMTRRLDPMERVKELGDASVPFPFDVHGFIFSESASDLETSLHRRLHNNRLNKVNLRKEFFSVDIEELEKLVFELEPTADFNKTILAEQYHQSLSINEL